MDYIYNTKRYYFLNLKTGERICTDNLRKFAAHAGISYTSFARVWNGKGQHAGDYVKDPDLGYNLYEAQDVEAY